MASDDMDRVVPLGQLDDFKVAEGEPDVRGWEVLASDGRKIGEVDELLVDTAAMKVRYLDVDVDDAMMAGGPDRHVLIPIGYARLEADHDRVLVDALASSDLAAVPSYTQGPLTRDFEASVRESFSARRGAGSTGVGGGSGMMDTAGLNNTPGTGTAIGTGMTGGTDSLSSPGIPGSDPGAMHSQGSSAGVMSTMDDGLGGARAGAGSQGPAGGAEREEGRGAMGGGAGHGSGLAGSDYMHNSDEDFYATDAFDDARFYGSRRRGGSADALGGGMSASPNDATRGNMGLSAGTGGADQVDQLSGSGLSRSEPTLHGAGQEGVGASEEETRRLAREASELKREDHQNRGVPGSGNF